MRSIEGNAKTLDDPMQIPAIEIKGLTKSYGRVQALRGVDLEVRQVEIFGFLGPNGAGKTTAIRCMLDLIRPDGGELRVLGMDPRRQSVEVRERTGYLPGELSLYPNLTARGMLRLLNSLRRHRADPATIESLAERLALDLDTPIKNLSKGNKQKAGLLQALMHRPELLILDEPTLGLDPLMQKEVLQILREARAAGTTVFFSSHNISEVEEVADRVGIIRKGRVVEVLEPESLWDRSLRRVRVRFRKAVDPQRVAEAPGVTLLDGSDGTSVVLQVTGEMGGLIRVLAQLPVRDLETERPTLEEIFLALYRNDEED